VSAAVDVGRHRVIDLFEGRNASDLDAWLEGRPEAWKAQITVAVADLHEPFRAAFGRHVGHAIQVADPFHSSASPPAPWTRSAAGSRTRRWDIGAANPARCTRPANC
jgi:Transposase